MAGLTLKLPVPKRQLIPRRLALPELPELTRTQRPSNPRRKSTPIVQDFRFQRRTPPVSTCEAPTLKPIIAKQTRKPSLKRKQVFPWSSSEDMETEPPSKRPKPRKNRKRKRKRKKKRKKKSESTARVLTPGELEKARQQLKATHLEPTTLRNLRKFAKKFKLCNRLDDWDHNEIIPPRECLENCFLENFVVQVWEENRSKPNVEQGHKYLNHCLANHNLPALNKAAKQYYAPVLAILGSIQKKGEWRDHVTQGAATFGLDHVMSLFNAPTVDPDTGISDKLALRNKAIACLMITIGGHPIDLWRMHEKEFEDRPNHEDRHGFLRPKMVFRGHHNKVHGLAVSNVVGCGCREAHDSENPLCLYNILKAYTVVKDSDDVLFLYSRTGSCVYKLGDKQRQKHTTEDNQLKPTAFFRSYRCDTNRFAHTRCGDQQIRDVFNYWNGRLGWGLEEAQAAMARKTFATMGDKFFGFPWREMMKVTHHQTEKVFKDYVVDAPWEDLEQDCHLGRTINRWVMGEYEPPVMLSVGDIMSQFREQFKQEVGKLQKSNQKLQKSNQDVRTSARWQNFSKRPVESKN